MSQRAAVGEQAHPSLLSGPRADLWLAAAVLLASAALVLWGGESTASLRSVWWLPVAVLQCAAVAVRRLLPAVALLIAWAGALLQVALVQEVGPQDVAILIVLYSAAAHGGRVTRALGLVSALAGGVLAGWFLAVAVPRAAGTQPGSVPFLIGLCTAILLLAWGAGLLRAVTRQAMADRLAAGAAAERARQAIAVEEERARIARDMHDVVAHSLTVMIAQAEGARLVAETRGGASPEALSAIADTGRSALTEVRGVLADLRSGDRDSAQPSLARLEALVARLRASGVAVAVSSSGEERPLPAAVDVAGFRIVQEALTNAVRHGGGSGGPTLHLEWADGALLLTVRNALVPGGEPPGHPPARGHGLIGMRERAHVVGGTVVTAVEDGAFVVTAVLPYETGERA
ncbi:sensor histidine kinase [Leifsonia shinshuensis]|uniref:sensor histidine kinase n=1 Tax=Leifsonia shinshuensis TaxID=150026 RepID=UPI001F508882|nr:histidine kinase [Leifsonia shinshuensis]MCI0157900.1 sensor histidine kinase [Leifsonia shinshuensis]